VIQYIVTKRSDPTLENAKRNIGARLLFDTVQEAWEEIEKGIKPCQRKRYTAIAVDVQLHGGENENLPPTTDQD